MPILINEIQNEEIYLNFTNKLTKIKPNILRQISQIEYSPIDVDKDRFQSGVFRSIVKMGTSLKLCNQIIHFMLMRKVVTSRNYAMWFAINNVLLRFSLTEFQEITRLSCGDEGIKEA